MTDAPNVPNAPDDETARLCRRLAAELLEAKLRLANVQDALAFSRRQRHGRTIPPGVDFTVPPASPPPEAL